VADQYVTVKTFTLALEAQLAKNLLQTEGIESFITGEYSADVLVANPAVGDQVRLQVHERDAQRAAGILAAHEASLDDDWEEQAEHGADVWVCPLCGSPVSNHLPVCYACQTPREGIRADRPRSLTDIQQTPDTLPPDPVQKRDEVTAEALPPLAPARPAPASAEAEEEEEEGPPELPGDVLARYAFGAAVFSFFFACLLPLAWYHLGRLALHSGELTPRATRFYHAALLIDVLLLLVWVGLCMGVLYSR
jgi:hypothetical protein